MHQHLLLVELQQTRELRRGRRLARALQSREQDHRRRLRREIERRGRDAHQGCELAMDDRDERLAGGQRAHHFLANGLVLHGGDEVLDDGQRHVGLEQGLAYLAERVRDIDVGQARFAAQRLDDAGEPLSQGIEHRESARACSRGARLW